MEQEETIDGREMVNVLENLVYLILCHLVGDYGIHREFISVTKGENWYHMFVHCALYCLPFLLLYGFAWQISVVFVTHFIIDSLKDRHKKISYVQDQAMHYLILFIYLL